MEDKEFHTNKIRNILIAALFLTAVIVGVVVAFGKIDAKEQKTMAASLIAVAVIIGLISALFAFITVAYAGWGLGPVLTAIIGIGVILGMLSVLVYELRDRGTMTTDGAKALWALFGIVAAIFASFDMLIALSSDTGWGIAKIAVSAAAISAILLVLSEVIDHVSK